MRKKLFYFCLTIVSVLIVGCSNNVDEQQVIDDAIEDIEYHVLLPEYIPSDLKFKSVITDYNLFRISYENGDGTKRIHITQDDHTYLNWERLLKFAETGENPYDKSPDFTYLKIGDFVGEYKKTPNKEFFQFSFIPIIPRDEISMYPYYRVVSVGLEENEFNKVIESLQ